MVSTVTAYTDLRNRAVAGMGFDGVVRVSVSGFYGSGILLYDGAAVLTAAHLFSHGSTSANVMFETTTGTQTVTSGQVSVMPDYEAVNNNHDLALVWLSGSAPLTAERYELYRANNEIGQTLTLVGYGVPGTGATGDLESYSGAPLRQWANNRFDVDAADLKQILGASMGWYPAADSQLVADFDNGTTTRDALGRLMNVSDTGLGQHEGLITSGDSGGPAFLDGKVAGVASYSASLSTARAHPDIDDQVNSSYGEISAWQRVSYYQQWIDQSLRAQYPNAPTAASQVQKQVLEDDSGTSLAYFLLQFNGVRANPLDWISVRYATRNGTALAGQDYLAISGTVVMYPGESQVAIPVEIMGDRYAEPDEFFYLDVTDPVGAEFAVGVVRLTAVRTIIDDDTGWPF